MPVGVRATPSAIIFRIIAAPDKSMYSERKKRVAHDRPRHRSRTHMETFSMFLIAKAANQQLDERNALHCRPDTFGGVFYFVPRIAVM
ncbi:MAG: hypothetical protein E7I13_01755 [Negativicoccus succinicivorans]|nr:hypothetical protein [Negativicoccus succinicivorans]MDU4202462.1 hypothetical protein [Negativicoccus succinicivorans]